MILRITKKDWISLETIECVALSRDTPEPVSRPVNVTIQTRGYCKEYSLSIKETKSFMYLWGRYVRYVNTPSDRLQVSAKSLLLDLIDQYNQETNK